MKLHKKGIFLLFFLFFIFISNSNAITNENILLAREFIKNGEFNKVISILEDEIKAYNPEAFELYCLSLLNSNKIKEGQDISKKYVKKSPQNLEYKLYYGYFSYLLKENDLKDKNFNEIFESDINSPNDISKLANLFDKFEFLKEANKLYIKGREKFNNPNLFLFDIINIFWKLNDYENVTEEIFKAYSNNFLSLETLKSVLLRYLKFNNQPFFENVRKKIITNMNKNNYSRDFVELYIWFNLYQKEFDKAIYFARSTDLKFSNGGIYLQSVLENLLSLNEIEKAIFTCNEIINLNIHSEPFYYAHRIRVELNAEKIINGKYSQQDLLDLEKNYEQTVLVLSNSVQGVQLMKKMAEFKAFYLGKNKEAKDLLTVIINSSPENSPIHNESKLILGDVYLLEGDIWEASLNYLQVIKTNKDNVAGEIGRYKNAKANYFKGDFNWAVAQLNALKGRTTSNWCNDAIQLSLFINDNLLKDSAEIVLNYMNKIDYLIFKNNLEPALEKLKKAEKELVGFSIMDDILYRQGEIYLKQKNYDSALICFSKVYTNFKYDILADDAIFQSGKIYYYILKDPIKSKETFEKLIFEFKNSHFIEEARNFLRILEKSGI